MSEELEGYARLLTPHAWRVREAARVIGPTRVGCAVLSDNDKVWVGCNVEHRFRSHDVHAEVNALSSLVAGGDNKAVAVIVVAERSNFTPCGSCMDWIFEIGGPSCWVGVQAAENATITWCTARDLMPHYPD